MRKIILGVFTFSLIAISCNKDKNFTSATIVDTGDITTSGCGYMFRFSDGREEKPMYLPSAYQHDGLKVLIKYHNTGILDTCRNIPPREFYDQVVVDDIKREL
jgi:hypothetical protein